MPVVLTTQLRHLGPFALGIKVPRRDVGKKSRLNVSEFKYCKREWKNIVAHVHDLLVASSAAEALPLLITTFWKRDISSSWETASSGLYHPFPEMIVGCFVAALLLNRICFSAHQWTHFFVNWYCHSTALRALTCLPKNHNLGDYGVATLQIRTSEGDSIFCLFALYRHGHADVQ